jgi:signal peptide peptidase-like protein 2B
MYSTGEERGSRFASLSSFAAMAQHQALLLLLCSLLLAPAPAWAVLPTSELIWGGEDLAQTNLLYAALAAFGPLTAPKDDALFVPLIAGGSACNLSMTMPIDPPFILVAERGNCTFDSKALAAQTAGASGIVVVNTLEGVYAGRDHGEPMDDYECENGEGWLAAPVSPSWNPTNDVPECSTDSRCESGVCMMTNVTDASLGTKVCCVWDTYINMGASKNGSADAVAIPSVFVTISEGSELLGSPLLEAGSLQGMLYDRPRPEFNASSFLLWGLGVATVGLAAWLSAGDLRRRRKRVKWGGHRQNGPEEESEKLTLTLQHTIGFVVVSSTMLMVLFFFELTTGVTVLFCLSALTSLSTIVTGPLVRKLLWNTMGNPEGRVWPVRFLEEITLAEVLSTFFSLIMVVWWVAVRQTADYAWLFQDLFGICLCIMFLDTLRIDSLKVATALLSLAFLYDIFWVFLSPYIFSESVMISGMY